MDQLKSASTCVGVLGLPDKGRAAPYRFARYWQYRYLIDRGYSRDEVGTVFGITGSAVGQMLRTVEKSPLQGTRAFRYPKVSECSVCRRPPDRLGLCRLHYSRLTKGIPLAAEEGYRPIRLETARHLARVKQLRSAGWTGPQITEDMQLSTTRVNELLAQAGFSGQVKRPLEHGIPARWQSGCQCGLCIEARREYKQAEHAAARQRAVEAWESGGHLPGSLCPCPDCRAVEAKKLADRLERTRETATQSGSRWSADEDEMALDTSRRIEDIAKEIGRTYAAVDNRRRYLARKLKEQARQNDTLES